MNHNRVWMQAQLILNVTDNLTILPRITVEITQIRFIATNQANSTVSKKHLSRQKESRREQILATLKY